MEFLRFGGHIPGNYWGCCACSVIQNFKIDPDTKMSSQVQYGDMGTPVPGGSDHLWVGPTYKDIFLARLRIGEFSEQDMPNHAFLAILTESQVSYDPIGKKWLAILKEQGFEFIRTFDNSVYNGPEVGDGGTPHKNHLFGLFRNIGKGSVKDQFVPPPAWTALPAVVPEMWDIFGCGDAPDTEALTSEVKEKQKVLWEALGPPKFLSQKEVEEAGAPVMLCGVRDITQPSSTVAAFPPQTKEQREAGIKTKAPLFAALVNTEGTKIKKTKARVAKSTTNETGVEAPLEVQTDPFAAV